MMESLSASPPAPGVAPQEDGIKCMYVDNCDTGSQPRKAISHIFGRNKLCTRMIPQPVWVHFCRKHYQRSRYRNAQEYSKLQCELVQKQLDRVHNWSEANKAAGLSGVVQDWSLSIRKREQKRLDEQNHAGGKKRRFRADDDDEEEVDTAALSGTAVPTWLLEKCNSGYTTTEIQEIVAQLKAEIDSGVLPQIPDIEILPNIITDSSEEGKTRVPIKRKTSAGPGAHKRSQSVGYTQGNRLDVTPMMRRTSQPGVSDWSADAMYTSPFEKRQRTATLSLSPFAMGDRQSHRGSLSQVPERTVPPMGHAQQAILPHRPASYSYGNIRENPVEEALYDNTGARNSQYGMVGPLPTPGTQQRLGQAMMPQPDNQGFYDSRRPMMHQRAQSEMGMFQPNPTFNYRAPMEYTAAPQGYSAEAMSYDAYQTSYTNGPPPYYGEGSMNRAYNPQGVWAPAPETQGSPYAMPPRHARHQSTSAVPQAIPRQPQTEDMYGSLQGSTNRFAGHPPQHRRQFSYGPSQSNPMEHQRIHENNPFPPSLYRDRR